MFYMRRNPEAKGKAKMPFFFCAACYKKLLSLPAKAVCFYVIKYEKKDSRRYTYMHAMHTGSSESQLNLGGWVRRRSSEGREKATESQRRRRGRAC